MTLSNKILLYTAVLRPILSYASPVWGYAANTNIKILEVAQNSLIRSIVRPGRYQADAARRLNVSRSVVQRLWDQYQSEDSVSRRPVPGLPRATTPAEETVF
ncbi:hypothetical protein TNCV_1141831 [Trichonephila clavipes]|nr:hypothetical protein TNCV_1141831 [Trichonephila clavipes]